MATTASAAHKQFTAEAWQLTGSDQGTTCGIEPAPPWLVLRTRSRQEKAVAADLSALGIDHFLPLVTAQRIHGRRKATVKVPLFTGYVFMRGYRDQAYTVDRASRLAQIIDVFDQQQMNAELQALRKAIAADAPLTPDRRLKAGMWVRVKAGPMQGVEGKIEHEPANRLVLAVDMLGQAASLEIDRTLLEQIEPPTAQTTGQPHSPLVHAV